MAYMVVPHGVNIDLSKFVPRWDEHGEFAGVTSRRQSISAMDGSISTMDAAASKDSVETRLLAILPTLQKTSADMLPAKQLLESGFLTAQQIVQLLNAKLEIKADTPADAIAALEGYERAMHAGLSDATDTGMDANDTGMDAADWLRKPSTVSEYLSPRVRPMSVSKYLAE
jgi:hypothetical protein